MSELLKEREHPQEPEDGFTVENDDDAKWCIEQIRLAKAEKDFWKGYYKEAQEKVVASCDDIIARMELYLMGYFKTVPHQYSKTEEKYDLPNGKIMMKKQNISYDYDESEVIEWLKKNKAGAFVKVKESLDWDGLKNTLMVIEGTVADGDAEIIPCITATEHEPVFKVQISKKKEG